MFFSSTNNMDSSFSSQQTMTVQDCWALAHGHISPQQAYAQGRLSVRGSLSSLMQLRPFVSEMRAKLPVPLGGEKGLVGWRGRFWWGRIACKSEMVCFCCGCCGCCGGCCCCCCCCFFGGGWLVKVKRVKNLR